jgi:hypothetical protein
MGPEPEHLWRGAEAVAIRDHCLEIGKIHIGIDDPGYVRRGSVKGNAGTVPQTEAGVHRLEAAVETRVASQKDRYLVLVGLIIRFRMCGKRNRSEAWLAGQGHKGRGLKRWQHKGKVERDSDLTRPDKPCRKCGK